MKVVQLIGTLDPRYGGPVAVARSLHRALASGGIGSVLVSLDAPIASDDDPDGAVGIGPAVGTYRYVPAGIGRLIALCADADVLLVHGIWQYQTRLAQRMHAETGLPYLVMVHGALDPWFRRTYPWKEPKKWVYWWLVEAKALRRAHAVVFSCEGERALAHDQFRPYRVRESVVAYGIDPPAIDLGEARDAFLSAHPSLRAQRIFLFVGRLHRKKGLDLLVDAWIPLAKRHADLSLVVAGPDQDGLWPSLRRRLARHGLEHRAHALGLISGIQKWGAYAAAELFCLPSHSENFGVVVAEALACSIPVLITDKVNIHPEVSASEAGVVVADTAADVRHGLRRWLDMPAEVRARMRIAARHCFETHFDSRRTVGAIEALIAQARAARNASGEGA